LFVHAEALHQVLGKVFLKLTFTAKEGGIMNNGWNSFVELLQLKAQEQPKDLAFTYLNENGGQEATLSFHELNCRAKAVGGYLQSVAKPGERVLLFFPSGLDFIVSFFGCLYAGLIAIPVFPGKREVSLKNIQRIILDAQVTVCLTNKPIYLKINNFHFQNTHLTNLPWKLIEDLAYQNEFDWDQPTIHKNDLALLQYTSGSTGHPKGVMVSHENLISNSEMIRVGFEHTKETVFVGWLPLFHDMGLVGNVLQPLYLGIHSVLMAPSTFVANPFLWLQAISKYRGTTSGGPNFSYDLCANKITPEEAATLDLSSWENAFIGAEPIFACTMEKFHQTFKPCGFRWDAFYPCYGMAEATLFISGGKKSDPPTLHKTKKNEFKDSSGISPAEDKKMEKTYIGCGKTWLDQEALVVDPETLLPCSENQEGEVWVRGDNVTQGYWNQPLETNKTFNNFVDDGRGPYLRTGDLAFINQGELFITGRIKDIIIINGRNHYPQDIEKTVERSHPSIRMHSIAAFSVEKETSERLAIGCEVKRKYVRNYDFEEIYCSIRTAIFENHAIDTTAIVLLKPGSIPKTSSNKIKRGLCRKYFSNGGFNKIGQWK
jgi:acyl-CoA synthetase (AMP-forming)/AMP-acid ligase II